MSAWFGGPTPAYNNPPIKPQYYEPSRFVISDLTYGETTTVTTSEDHNYVVGQLIRLLIPFQYGAQQLTNKQGKVISIPSSTQVIVDISSLDTDSFISNPSLAYSEPQIIAIGDYNSGAINSSGRVSNITYIEGSFINISPQ